MDWTKQEIAKQLEEKCLENFGCNLKEVTLQQAYEGVCLLVREILIRKRRDFQKQMDKGNVKQVYYMSMEFLVGTSLRSNLYNLGLEDEFKDVLKKVDLKIDQLYDIEPDAGLGNGGLGRLAACYMDALTSCSYPATGFSIRYELGIFKQKIVDGWQMEFPDDWLQNGGVWLNLRKDRTYEVHFGGKVAETFENGKYTAVPYDYETVIAVPYDMMMSGHDTDAVNPLILWSAKSPNSLDMSAFARGEYMKSLEQNTMAEVISKVLYPADDHEVGKILRLRQQYLLVSASLQQIVDDHMEKYGTLYNLQDKVAIHINDTHPALCVPELMRLLIDDYGFEWDDAWKIVGETLSYTNHTVMSEALERWPVSIFSAQLPRVYQIVCEINRRLLNELHYIYANDQAKIDYMSIISHGQVHMANLCLCVCHKVNGVSKLHSDILKNSIFRDYYNIYPKRFTNVTNGIAYRRWLCQSNPELSGFLTELIGDGFVSDANELEKLMKYHDDSAVLKKLQKIKYDNKVRLSNYIIQNNGIKVDPNSIFDVQVKRLHEYKRQLLNVFNILHLYNQIKANPSIDMEPRTFIFAAKASSGYFMAKQIIRLIACLSNVINTDPMVRDKIKVVFLADYKVSLAEIIMPAADISEQISIAGKEASGTGNMKLMINGAVTIGTLDGANVEILEQVGKDNMFLFGLTAEEVADLWHSGYDSMSYYNSNRDLKAVVDLLNSEALGTRFTEVTRSLMTNAYGAADAYMTFADFSAYVEAQKLVEQTYRDKRKFTNMSLVNIAKAGLFSADRAVKEYCDNIWKMNPLK